MTDQLGGSPTATTAISARFQISQHIPFFLLLGAACAVLAGAPTRVDAAAEGAAIEEIIVTGTHLRRGKFDMASPIEVIDAGDIETSGYSNIGPYIRDLTYTENVDTVANVLDITDGQQDSSSARFNLRGLGASSTLTLFDGRRVLNDGAVAGIVPDIALQRVELILDGGAATYGTDAVAGVVNFIPVKEFDGFRIRGFYSEDSRGDNAEPKLAAMWGKTFDRLNVVAALEWTEKDGMYRADRPKYLAADNDTSTSGNPGTFTGPVTFLGFGADPTCGTFNGDATDDSERGSFPSGQPAILIAGIPAVCAWEYGEYQDYIRPNEDLVGYLAATYRITDEVTFEFLLNYDNLDTTLLASPSTAERGSNDLLVIPANHPANPFTNFISGQPTAVTPRNWRPFGKIGTLPSHLTSRGSENTDFPYEALIATASIEFPLGDTGWLGDVAVSRQRTDFGQKGNTLRRSRLEAALQGMGGPNGDQWFNPFGSVDPSAPGFVAGEIGQGGTENDQALVDWLYSPYDFNNIITKYWSIEGVFSGTVAQLPAGDMLLALGAQYRKTDIANRVAPFDRIGDDYNTSPVNPPGDTVKSESAVQSVFFETDIPIVENLTMTVAGRYEDFTDLDLDAFVPKVSFRYTPIETLSLRASYGEGFLAPTVEEITPDPSPTCAELFTGNDPFTGADLTGALSCTSGNPVLLPEESELWNIGFTWIPIEDLELSLDYQEIEYTDRIVRLGTVDTLQRDLANLLVFEGLTQAEYDALADNDPAAFDALLTSWYTGPNTDPNITRDGTGDVIQVVRIPGNVAVVNVSVIDLRFNYGLSLGDAGYLSTNFAHTQYVDYDYQDPFGNLIDAIDKRNGDTDAVPPIPRYRSNLRFAWLKDRHSLALTVKHQPSLDFDGATGPTFVAGALDTPDEIKSYTTVDVRYGIQFDDVYGGVLGLAVGSNNLFDKDAQALPILGGFETRIQSPVGRTYFLELSYGIE